MPRTERGGEGGLVAADARWLQVDPAEGFVVVTELNAAHQAGGSVALCRSVDEILPFDPGGCHCSAGPAGWTPAWALLLVPLWLARRRR